MPSLPVKRENVRVRPEDTPSHGTGLTASAREKLEARRRERNAGTSSAVSALKPERGEREGLGDFQSRLNRAEDRRDRDHGQYDDRRRDNGYGDRDRTQDGRDDRGRPQNGGWDSGYTPRGSNGRDGGGSMRVPNKGWDETPRRGPGGSSGATPRRSWDETPRNGRNRDGDSPEMVNGKEWEEEQVRLDRDWYSYDDEGQVVCPAVQSMAWVRAAIKLTDRLVTRSTTLSRSGRTWKDKKKRRCSRRLKSVKQLVKRNT